MGISDRLGQQIGNYRLVRFLGQGGFADVYLGEHIYLGTLAALKMVRASVVGDDTTHFYTEGRTVAHLIHPHIVRVLEFGVQDTVPYLVLDYAPGGSLRTLHPKGHLLPLDTVRSYVDQVAAALQYAHQQKIVHRDVKPENMLLGKYHEVLLSDFGIALITQSSQSTKDLAGTVAYMAPEQIRSHPRPASDQYSLGIVVYEWLTGERPFDGSFTELAVKHSVVPPPPLREKMPTIPLAVEQVVLTAMAKEPDQRFGCIQDFAIAFAQACRSPWVIQGSQTSVQPFSPYQAQLQPPSLYRTDSSLNLSVQQSHPFGPGMSHALNPSMQQPRPLSSEMSHALNPSMQRPRPLSSEMSHVPNPSMQQPRPLSSEVSHLRKRGVSRRALIGDGLVILAALAASGTVWDFMSHSSTGGGKPGPRLPYIYRGHYPRPVWSVSWSPDGKRIASASEDHTVQVWDAIDGGHPYTYRGHSSTVYGVAWSPERIYIASADMDGIVQVWNAADGTHFYTYKGHSTWVRAVAWSPDGKRIVSAGGNSNSAGGNTNVQVWNANNGGNPYLYQGHSDAVFAVAWSPDGKRIASAGYDTTVQVWDAVDGGNRYTYKGHSSVVRALAWSSDGKRIASAGEDKTVQVWDATNGGNVYTYKGHLQLVQAVAWSPDGKRIASAGNDMTVQAWDATNGGFVYAYKGHESWVFAVAWSSDGKWIASAGGDSTVQVWQSA